MRHLILCLALVGCGSSSSVTKDELRDLELQKARLDQSVGQAQNDLKLAQDQKARLDTEVQALNQNATVLKALAEGRGIHYIFTVSIRQVSYSLSLRKQMRDAVNEERFDMPTDKVTYEKTQVGDDLFDGFRAGSAYFHGSLGSWRLRVENKRIEKD